MIEDYQFYPEFIVSVAARSRQVYTVRDMLHNLSRPPRAPRIYKLPERIYPIVPYSLMVLRSHIKVAIIFTSEPNETTDSPATSDMTPTFGRIRIAFDADGQLDSIAPRTRPIARLESKTFRIFSTSCHAKSHVTVSHFDGFMWDTQLL